MRNNKNINIAETPVGTRVKVAIPSYWAHHNKDRFKKYSWFKGKLINKYDNGSFVVMIYPTDFIGRMFFPSNSKYRIVKCL